MNPTDQPPSPTAQSAAESPTLWLSLALGSVLIHLVLFILASLIANQPAKVQLDIDPIAVEFVDPNATRSTASGRAIAVRPGKPSATQPSSAQIRPNVQQSTSLKQPVEQPFTPLQPVKPQRPSVRPQQAHPNPTQKPITPQPPSSSTSQTQIKSSSNGPQGGTPNTPPGNGAEQTSGSQEPARSETKLTEPPQAGDASVNVSGIEETADRHKAPARIQLPVPVSIRYVPLIAQELKQGIRVSVHLDIDQFGFGTVMDARLLSSSAIDPATLDDLAKQIFEKRQFEPAQDAPDGLPLKPQRSDPTITATIQLL